ncbi:hypothetical protein ACJMK2_020291, partial [Sinanodonta woodiana]
MYKSKKMFLTLKKKPMVRFHFNSYIKAEELNTSTVIIKPLKRNLEEKKKYWNIFSKGLVSSKNTSLPDGTNCSCKSKNIDPCQVDHHSLYNSCRLFDRESAMSKEAGANFSSSKVSFVPLSADDCARDVNSFRFKICNSPETEKDDVSMVFGAIKKESKK